MVHDRDVPTRRLVNDNDAGAFQRKVNRETSVVTLRMWVTRLLRDREERIRQQSEPERVGGGISLGIVNSERGRE